MKKNLYWKRVFSLLLAILMLFGSLPINVLAASDTNLLNSYGSLVSTKAAPFNVGPFKNIVNTLTLDQGYEELCKRTLTGELTFDWPEPTTYVDVVFVQDFSGSFDDTIVDVGTAVKSIAGSLNFGTDVDGKSPKDRAMIVSFQGRQRTASIGPLGVLTMGGTNYSYSIKSSVLATLKSTIDGWVNTNYRSTVTDGATPTIDGMKEAMLRYKSETPSTTTYNNANYSVNGNARQRKTIYILITDGAANAARYDYLSQRAKNALNFSGSAPGSWGFGANESYLWSDARKKPDGAYYSSAGSVSRYEAYEAMLIGMEDIATEIRNGGGINNTSASFV